MRTFANMRSRCKARAKINRRRIFDTLRINFCAATPQMPSDLQKINAIGSLEKAERGNEILLTRSYDKAGRLVREKKQGAPEKTYRYDALGRLTEVRSAGAVQAQYRYGTYGKTVTYTDGAGSEYLFEKDGYGLLTTEQDRLGKQRAYRYSKEDELTEAKQRNGEVRSVTRTKGKEITTYRDGSRYEILKDISGVVIYEKGIDGEGKLTSEVTYRYDEAGQLVEQADDAGDTRIIYRYNKAGYRTEMQTNDRYVVYDLDGRGRVTEVSDRKQYFKVKAFYDENNREVRRILGNGNKQDYTYDEAGRLLGIVETDSNWAIIRAECYGYDGEGRRIFTADEKGNLTRYVYDEQYRIKEVQYPVSEELRAYHREEAKETRLFIDEGAASHRREIMNPVELAQISANFSRLVGARTSNLGSLVNSIQLVWTEQYTYDANGNIATKTTPYGTIHYSYDKENRLLTRDAVHYTYDEEGNLLREEQNDYYLKRYEYAGFNRMEMSDIINYRDNTHVITDYRYDSFGRRIHTAERTKTGMRTIYDGLSFEVVKEAETFLGTRGITSSATGEANLTNYTPHGSDHTRGTRYYFIRDRGQELRTGKSGEALPDRTKGARTYLYLNGERVAVNNLYNTNHGQYYYGSDILGSVKFVSGQGGQELKRIEYDVFGGIYKGASPYGLETGYTGKPYDAVTGLSDYGFRDYSPTHARFITEDPIRDGENWFAYVGNNPVNWIDPWGLSASDGKRNNSPTFGTKLKDLGRRAADALQSGAHWVWNNRQGLLKIGLGTSLMFAGETVKRSGQFFGITIAVGGSLGTAGLGSPAAVGTGITIGVSATTVGNAIQLTGAALMIEGSKNLKGNDDNRKYKSNPKHHKNSKSPKLQNAKDMFNHSIDDPRPNRCNTKWYKDKNGIIHRFQGQNNTFHWNGSTAGENPISPNDIPIEIKRLSEGEL